MIACPAELSVRAMRSHAVVGDKILMLLHSGSGAFLGLAAYNYMSGMGQLEKNRPLILKSKSKFGMQSRKMGIISISIGLTYLGIWRFFR